MPELPEVESVRRLFERVLKGHKIVRAEVPPDDIMLSGRDPDTIRKALEGRTVRHAGRRGKFWWLEFDEPPFLFGHLGMSGWVRELGQESRRLHAHGDAPLDDADGRPRYLKLLIETEEGRRVAFTDGRRLGRLWLGESPEKDRQVSRLSPDVYEAPRSVDELVKLLAKRKPAIKALLLDQTLFAGVGNWIADEVLYQAKIAPARAGSSLDREEISRLHRSLAHVLGHAVKVDADYKKFPETWLFSHRWGGAKGSQEVGGHTIKRETIGGRTTAWVPDVQS